jgi:hypothetical protein
MVDTAVRRIFLPSILVERRFRLAVCQKRGVIIGYLGPIAVALQVAWLARPREVNAAATARRWRGYPSRLTIVRTEGRFSRGSLHSC